MNVNNLIRPGDIELEWFAEKQFPGNNGSVFCNVVDVKDGDDEGDAVRSGVEPEREGKLRTTEEVGRRQDDKNEIVARTRAAAASCATT